jgi:hypothetical protein
MGVKTLPLTLRDEHRLRMSEKRLLRRIFGPKKDEIMGEWKKKKYNEELYNVLLSLWY